MSKTDIASVIEPSKELQLSYKPLVITSNLKGLAAYVENITEPFLTGELDLSTPDLEKDARAALADLNKAVGVIDKRRVEVIKELKAPIEKVDREVKEIVSKGKEAYRLSKGKIDAKVAEDQETRKKELELEYIGIVGEEVARTLPYERIANPSWHTKSYGEIKAEKELFERAEKIVSDIKILNDHTLAHPESVMVHFLENLDLSRALAYDKELTELEKEAERQAEEVAEAFKLSSKPEPIKESPSPVVEQSEEVTLSDYTLILRSISVFDAKDIARYAEKISGKRPELKKGVVNG